MLDIKIFILNMPHKIFVKKSKRLGINIVAENEPYFCSACKLIVNKQCKGKKCVNTKKLE